MEVRFEEKYLFELYKFGRTTDKSHRFQPEVVRKYKERIRTLRKVQHVKELLRQRLLYFKALEGDQAGNYSIRVDGKYRLSFTVSIERSQPVITICHIMKLSNHYD